MPPPGIFNLGKQPPTEPRRPIAAQYGSEADERQWRHQLFIKYLIATRRLGGGDLGPAPKEQP